MKMHVFATIMALYPFTKTEDIAKEFGISAARIRLMAKTRPAGFRNRMTIATRCTSTTAGRQ